jgi:hypothetical protein
MEAFSYVTIYYEIFRVRAFLLSTRDRNLLVEFMTLLKDGEMRSPLVNGVEINHSGERIKAGLSRYDFCSLLLVI